MKNLILFASLCFFVFGFYSCQDESFEQFETEIAETNTATSGLTRSCGHAAHMEKLLSNPTYKVAHETKLQKAVEMKNSIRNRTAVTIPIAVHYQGATGVNTQCLIDLAQEQIDVLNDDFKGTNGDISNWTGGSSSSFPGISNGAGQITFTLADQNHPSGYNLTNGQPAVTVNQTTGDQNNAWAGYLNIYVQFGTGVLGYAPLGGSGNGDGVVIEGTAFGSGSQCGNIGAQAPFNLGRTTTHEVGHYLLLDHIWGGGCNQDDLVADTPDANDSNFGCPSVGISSCGSTDMHMNYMDYTDDACMYMFSAGQVSRSENYVASNLTNLTSNASNVIGGTTPPPPPPAADADGDGVPDASDNCPNVANANQADTDGDGVGNVCDNCPNVSNANQADANGNGIGDACESTPPPATDTDGDGVPDASDNCPNVANANQADANGNGIGDACESTPPPPSGCTQEEITIRVILDDYGSETKWVLKNSSNQVVKRGGPYQDFQAGTVEEEILCLPADCYKLILKDSYGDGMCCNYGEGELEVLDDSGYLVAYSDGYFGRRDVMRFCVGPNTRQAGPSQNERDEKVANLPAKMKRTLHTIK